MSPRLVEVEIEVPRGGLVKRRADGRVDFVSPVPCPFNYGAVPGTVSGDGDPRDVVLLGPRHPRGARVRAELRGIVRFVDGGLDDPKWVCSDRPLTARDRRRLRRFFVLYGRCKRLLNLARGVRGRTGFLGWQTPAG